MYILKSFLKIFWNLWRMPALNFIQMLQMFLIECCCFSCFGQYEIKLDSMKWNWAGSWENMSYFICQQQKPRSACAFAQSDQRLCCSLPRQNDTSSLCIRNFKILAGRCSWACQFVSCLVGDSRRHIFSWPGSIRSTESLVFVFFHFPEP